MKIHHHQSLDQLETAGGAWDELWQRSGCVFPSTQCRLISQWIRHFAPGRNFHAITVQHNGTLQAALPLVELRWKKAIRIASLPGNEWSPIGNLLLNWSDDSPSVVAALVEALSDARWSLVQLDPIRLDALQWRLFVEQLKQTGHPLHVEALFDVGQVNVDGDWDAYFRSRSRNLRKDLGKAWRRLEAVGKVDVETYTDPDDELLAELMRSGFEVEDRSWKSRQGTSVLKMPGMLEYYTHQAALLRDRGQLQISMLKLDGNPIAFEYGWHSHGTYFSFKVGYDEAYERHSPGQLLRMKLIERFFADPNTTTVDFFGPLNHALAAWSTESVPIGRIVAGRPTLFGRTTIDVYRRLRSLRNRLRRDRKAADYKLRPYERAVAVSEKTKAGETVGQSLP